MRWIMRVARKEIKDVAIISGLLESAHVGRLGTVGKDGYPVVKPLNFVYRDGSIYFHSAPEGEKMDHIRRDARVCFEVDLPIAYARNSGNPCDTDYLYRSVIIRGRAMVVEAAGEKRDILGMLLKKYEPRGNVSEFPEHKVDMTAIVRIEIESMTGKEDLGSGDVRESVLKAIADGAALPLLLDK
jgi:uncharacterized protein